MYFDQSDANCQNGGRCDRLTGRHHTERDSGCISTQSQLSAPLPRSSKHSAEKDHQEDQLSWTSDESVAHWKPRKEVSVSLCQLKLWYYLYKPKVKAPKSFLERTFHLLSMRDFWRSDTTVGWWSARQRWSWIFIDAIMALKCGPQSSVKNDLRFYGQIDRTEMVEKK